MTRAIMRKDLLIMWASPIPWVVGALFHLVLGLLYVAELIARRQALIQPLFPLSGFLLLATVPMLTMRSVAEEARSGTLDLLQAIPVKTGKLVVGKWLACWLSALGVVAPAGVAVILLSLYGEPDPGPAFAGFLGIALISAALSAIGVFTSSLTSSQPVAAVFALFIGLILWFAHVGSQTIPTGSLLAHFSISERLRSFATGVVDSADIGFLMILVGAALVGAATALDGRRLR
jgi:ABC-2 type transport system permease protein